MAGRKMSSGKPCQQAVGPNFVLLVTVIGWTVSLLPGKVVAIKLELGMCDHGIRMEGSRSPDAPLLHEEEFVAVELVMDRALAYVAGHQLQDGSFQARVLHAQPAVTSLSITTFLAGGHVPREGPYGTQLE